MVASPPLPRLRLLHHWACSGGTLFAKVAASLPQVLLLNEVHPYAHLRHLEPQPRAYLPSDLCHQLAQSHNGRDPVLVLATFCGGLEALLRRAEAQGQRVVVRSHDHIDFFTGVLPGLRFTLVEAMAGRCRPLRLLTVRHPLDCWLSLRLTDWVHQTAFASAEEFFRRCLAMLEAAEGVPHLRYEGFVTEPMRGLAQLTTTLELPFDPTALERFGRVVLSGDSGRSSAVIEARPRRLVDADLHRELGASSRYAELCDRLAYSDDPEAPFPYGTFSTAP
ncbi:MAG: hypothetical protein ACKOZW_01380 [Cyanobium sp.]